MYRVASQRKILGMIFFSAEFLFSGPFYVLGGGHFFSNRNPRIIPMPDVEDNLQCIGEIVQNLELHLLVSL